MTRFLKITSIIAICILLVGILLSAAGTFFGGGGLFRRDSAAGSTKLLQEIGSGLSSFSDHIPHLSINSKGIYFTGDTPIGDADPLARSEDSFDASVIKKLDIDAGAGRILIKEQEGSEQTIDVSAEIAGRLDIRENNGTLHIKVSDQMKVNNRFYFGFDTDDSTIEVRIPKGYHAESADLSLGAGEIDIEKLSAGNASFTVGAGRLAVEELSADTADISVAAGECDIDRLDSKTTNLDVNLGKVDVDLLNTDSLDASVDMGEIEFKASGSQTDYDYEINCGMGNIEVDGRSYSGMGVTKSISNSAGRKMELSCSMGNIEVEFDD